MPMLEHKGLLRASLSGMLATWMAASVARAADEPPAPAAPPAAPPPTQLAAATPTALPDMPAPAAPAATVEKSAPKEDFKKFDPPSVWMRLDNRLQGRKDKEKLNDIANGAEVDLLLSGQVHEYVKWQADFVATFGTYGSGSIDGKASILDLIGKFESPSNLVNVWFGRMLVPSDRANFAGPWFMSPWNYPGFFPAARMGGAPVGPRQGPFGRNDGATVWGQFLGGYVKYYAGAFDLHDLSTNPLISARLNFSLLNPEPYYYHSATYYGRKDIVALGLGLQYKKGGSVEPAPAAMPAAMDMPATPAAPFVPMTEDYSELSADLLVEKTLGHAGTGTLEGCFYKFNGKYEPVDNDFFVLGSWLLPWKVGVGKFQPLVRYQQAKATTIDGSPENGDWRLVDAQVGYVVDTYAMRVSLGYQNADIAGAKGNAVQLGIQIQK